MSEKMSKMKLNTLIKNWPTAEYDILVQTAHNEEDKTVIWGKTEQFFIELSERKYFYK